MSIRSCTQLGLDFRKLSITFACLLITAISPLLIGRTEFLDNNLERSLQTFLLLRRPYAFPADFTVREIGLNLFVAMAIIHGHSKVQDQTIEFLRQCSLYSGQSFAGSYIRRYPKRAKKYKSAHVLGLWLSVLPVTKQLRP